MPVTKLKPTCPVQCNSPHYRPLCSCSSPAPQPWPNLTLHGHDRCLLVGSKGAGKTTILKIFGDKHIVDPHILKIFVGSRVFEPWHSIHSRFVQAHRHHLNFNWCLQLAICNSFSWSQIQALEHGLARLSSFSNTQQYKSHEFCSGAPFDFGWASRGFQAGEKTISSTSDPNPITRFYKLITLLLSFGNIVALDVSLF